MQNTWSSLNDVNVQWTFNVGVDTGFSIDEMNNPPDFFLDVINGETDLDHQRLETQEADDDNDDDDQGEGMVRKIQKC